MMFRMGALLGFALLLGSGCKHSTSASAEAPRAPEGARRPPKQGSSFTSSTQSPLDAVVAEGASWYDPAPLLVSIRPSARDGLAARAGLKNLSDLPLYNLSIKLDPEAGTFDVDEEVFITNTEAEPLSEVVFVIHGNLQPDSAPKGAPRIAFTSGACSGTTCKVTSTSPSVVRVEPSAPVAPGSRLRVTLRVSGILERMDPKQTDFISQSLSTLMKGNKPAATNYGLLSYGAGVASMANFYPVLASRDKGQWRVPDSNGLGDTGSDDLCHVRAKVEVPALARIATPGSVVHEALVVEKGAQPKRTIDVAAAMVRDFSLFVTEEWTTTAGTVGDVTVKSHYFDQDSAPGMRVLEVAKTSLEGFERRFGPYPYAEFDVVEAPLVGGAGGVEMSGLIVVASMFYRPFGAGGGPLAAFLSGLSDKQNPITGMIDSTLEFVTAHEVAHQWWHVLVGSDSRQHPCVDESLTQFTTILYLEDRYGEEKAIKVSDMQVKMNYQGMRMMGEPDGPADRPVSGFRSPTSYAGLVYGKAPYMYRDLRKLLGDEAFFKALRTYADTYSFRIAPRTGPLPLLSAGAKQEEANAIAKRWLEQAHGDEDLGKGSFDGMFGGMLGPDAAGMSSQVEDLLRLLGPALQGGGKGQAGGKQKGASGKSKGASGKSKGTGKGAGKTPQDPMEMMRLLEQMMKMQ